MILFLLTCILLLAAGHDAYDRWRQHQEDTDKLAEANALFLKALARYDGLLTASGEPADIWVMTVTQPKPGEDDYTWTNCQRGRVIWATLTHTPTVEGTTWGSYLMDPAGKAACK